jgi:hypothetical protein
MSGHLFPRTIDNTYRGHKLALPVFGLLLLMRLAMSVNSMFYGAVVLTSADGVPLDTYPPAAAGTIVALFALNGLSHLMMALLGILVLARYRGMIPFMFALLLMDQLGRKVILQFLPIVRIGAPPASTISAILLGLMITGLALSLWRRPSPN